MPRLKQKMVRARKTHWCEACEKQINKGRICFYLVDIVDKEFHHGWFHISCIKSKD